jgi:hypothetical protein
MKQYVPKDPPLLCDFYGQVWEFDIVQPGIGCWFIYCPTAHPLWYAYLLSVIHLREIPDMPPPIIYLPGATHEIILVAMDPEYNPSQSPNPYPYRLVPTNFVAQFIAESDGEARKKCMVALAEIVKGLLSPDTDAMAQWIERFGDNMIRK